jgi:hypothetical protein
MRHAFFILIAFFHLNGIAQDSIALKPIPRQTEVTIAAERHTHLLNTAHATGINIGISQPIGEHFALQAQSFLTPVISWDPSKRILSSLVGNDQNVRTPSYNVSSLTIVWSPITGSNVSEGKRGQKQRDYSFGIRGGYFYHQLTYPCFRDLAYLQTDTTAIGEAKYIFGMQTHALSVGLEFIKTKQTAKKTVSSTFYADFLYGVHFQYIGYTHNADGSYSAYSPDINRYPIIRKGARVGFKYTHFRKGHWGGFCALEAFWKPMLGYYPRSPFLILRGGERLWPGAISARVGVVYRVGK